MAEQGELLQMSVDFDGEPSGEDTFTFGERKECRSRVFMSERIVRPFSRKEAEGSGAP